ncbi:MAG: hypothetical protein U0744_08520 [Gemmataceae bacterium]
MALGKKDGFILRIQDADDADGPLRSQDVEEGFRADRNKDTCRCWETETPLNERT